MEGLVTKDFWAGKKVLITGHTGFKGSWLTLWLRELGAEVTGMALPNNNPCSHYNVVNTENVTSYICDIRNIDNIKEIFIKSEPEIVFHLAAQPLVNYSYIEPMENYTTNINGTLNILEVLRKTKSVKSMLVITTDKVYRNINDQKVVFNEECALGGYDPYSASKAMTEILCESYRSSFYKDAGIALATARAGNVIGGGDWSADRLIPDFYRAIRDGRKLEIRYPHSVRPWQHVLESLRGYLMYAEHLHNNNDKYVPTLNFGPDEKINLSVKEVVEILSELNNPSFQIDIAHKKKHESSFLSLSSEKANLFLNWSPVMTFHDAFRLTHEWYKAQEKKLNMREISLSQINSYQILCKKKQEMNYEKD